MFSLIVKLSRLKIKDSMLLGIVGGLIGITCMDISNFILFRAKLTEVLYGHLAGSMITRPYRLNGGKNFFIGQLFHMTVGSSIGVVMTQILKKFGKDHHIVKGGFLSVVTWGFLYNFGQRMGFYRANPRLTKSGYAAIWHHLIYGLATSHAIVTLADPVIFSQTTGHFNSLNTENNPGDVLDNSKNIHSEINRYSSETIPNLN